MTKSKIPSTDEAWENRTLGAEEAYVKVDESGIENEIDEAAGTQLISIRMQRSMIDDLKAIATFNNEIGYQTLMKQILQRFIEGEKKKIWNDIVSEKLRVQKTGREGCEKTKAPRHQKAA